MIKEKPFELNQKIRRLKASREGLKACNREKAKKNKMLLDRTVELTENRDHWKTVSKTLRKEKEELKEMFEERVRIAEAEAARERARADEERARADKFQAQVEEVWKKKSRT